jgi:TPR repeat protein
MARKRRDRAKAVSPHWAAHLAANPDFAVFCEAEEAEERGDLRTAVRLFKRSSAMGCLPAMARLGTLYDDILKPPRRDLALYWYKRGVRRGDYVAAQNLAMHYKARGQTRWYIYWLTRAAEMGDEDSRAELGSLA